MSTTAPQAEPCQHCGMNHSGKCPLVKAIEYFPDGAVKRVEFYDPPKIEFQQDPLTKIISTPKATIGEA